jgi:hypothetical protein
MTAILFTPSKETENLRPRIVARKYHVPYELDIADEYSNACNFLRGAQCPLKANKETIYLVKLPISSSCPKIDVELEISLNGDHERVMCFKFDAIIE